ncbi:MAG TPA: efflux RND transporter permease subunit [Candidatus Dormibacteraeota bacterium]|jgi:HAE1 family hydrophobic/amphiphilic exporter-1|nr:efflux RND transporter permease subunit [Candidatus Dormibacteraeota bacterium]
MSGFSIKYPFLIVVACLIIAIVGGVTLVRMPVDLFPPINIPVVVVATFYSGMPPQQIETNITNPFERFFTLASGVDHIESRSLPGVSLIKIYFQPGTNADADLSTISNLAMADLRRLPPGTLPPVVLKFDASSLPVCLITLKGEGLNETELHDIGQYTVRNQIAGVPGASVPQPFGGRYRQIMVYVDPMKLQANQLSAMDVVRQLNDSNLILPAGDVRIGPYDYNLYSNSQAPTPGAINKMPLKTIGQSSVLVADIGKAEDAQAIQTNVVRVDGQASVYLPILKQGGDTNTIAVVDGIKIALKHLVDVPKQLVTRVVFDQSVFVKTAIETLLHEGAVGLVLTGLMILLFLGSMRATAAVFFSIPLSALAAFLAISAFGGTVNTMVLGGLALAFSRLIDNSVIVLENIFRHLEMGESPQVAAEKGGREVALAVLAATLTTAVVFFPVIFLYGVSRFLFTALALAVVLSLFASYFVAMTVVPLFCARYISKHEANQEIHATPKGLVGRTIVAFDGYFAKMLGRYDSSLAKALLKPASTALGLAGISLLCFVLYPLLGVSFFPRTDAGQFVINLKAPSGTRIEMTENYVKQVEGIVRQVVPKDELRIIVSNIGVTTDFSAIYTPNSAGHTAFVQVSLRDDHKVGSYEYMRRVRAQIARQLPQLSAYFQSGGLVDSVLNLGLPAPIDVQVSGTNLDSEYETASQIASQVRQLRGVSDVLIPQDVDYPALQLDIDREKASQLGLSQKEIVDNVITALTSNGMIAPNYWIDPKSGIPYLLTVQYPEDQVKTLTDLKQIPLRGVKSTQPTFLDSVVKISTIASPTEVDHYQLFRVVDLYVSPKNEDLGRITSQIEDIIKSTKRPENVRVDLRGSVQGMRSSFKSFGIGLILSVVLVYLILIAQFASWKDPFIILLAVPPGLAGVLLTLLVTSTTLNVMSLMGLVMMVGIVVSNSILIVEFARHLHLEGKSPKEAVAQASRARLRPILMTSLATVLGLLPMALKLGTGSEAYAPLARAILGGLLVSVVVTIYLVPAAYLLLHGKTQGGEEAHA